MKNLGTKSINMSNVMVYLVMFVTTIDKILWWFGPHKMKMSHNFSVFDPSGTWDFLKQIVFHIGHNKTFIFLYVFPSNTKH